MARPRKFGIEDAEAKLLDVFWSRGYAGTSLRDLCEATEQRPASLYAAFGDKDEMYAIAMRRYAAWIESELSPRQDGAAGVRHILEAVARLTLEDGERRGCPIINSVAERENLSAQANAFVSESFAALRALFRRQVKACVGSDSSGSKIDAIVSLLVGATISIRVLGRAGATTEEIRRTAMSALDAFETWRSGYSPRSGRRPAAKRVSG